MALGGYPYILLGYSQVFYEEFVDSEPYVCTIPSKTRYRPKTNPIIHYFPKLGLVSTAGHFLWRLLAYVNVCIDV